MPCFLIVCCPIPEPAGKSVHSRLVSAERCFTPLEVPQQIEERFEQILHKVTDRFRLRHLAMIGRFVREVVLGRMDKRAVAGWIAREAFSLIPQEERARFIQMVETELGCLHRGNIVRYRLRPSEFDSWNQGWK